MRLHSIFRATITLVCLALCGHALAAEFVIVGPRRWAWAAPASL